MQVLVLSSCSSRKRRRAARPLTPADFLDRAQRPRTFDSRVSELMDKQLPAEAMYVGLEHRHVSAGVGLLRRILPHQDVSWHIVSAGYGLIDARTPIVPYDCSFSSMSLRAAQEWGGKIGLHDALREALLSTDLALLVLGERYLDALRLAPSWLPRATVLFGPGRAAERLRQAPGVACIAVGRDAARKLGHPVVALKGWLFRYALCQMAGASNAAALAAKWSPEQVRDAISRRALRILHRGLSRRASR